MDCVEGIKLLEDSSIDIAIADPPYNVGIDFGFGGDVMPWDDYFAWCDAWIAECLRVLKPNGTLFIYGYPEISAMISVKFPIDKQRWLMWHYSNHNIPHAQFWQRSHQSIVCHWKGRKPMFNRDAVREPYTEAHAKRYGKFRPPAKNPFSMNDSKETATHANPDGALPRDKFIIPASSADRIIYCNTCGCIATPKHRQEHKGHDLLTHPAQKPYAISERLILSCKPKGEFNVLVPFCGSSSECLVALKHGGSFFAFEINPDYVKLASKNLEYYLNTRSYFA
jgi:site-specific DNA-methyltransferase (adenine-specific)